LKWKASEFVGMDIVDWCTDNKLSEITHGREEMTCSGLSKSSAGVPEIAMQHNRGGGDGPAEENFAVSTDALVGEDAMSAFLDPVHNILMATGPEEAHADAEQSFAHTEVTTNRAAMKHIKDERTQRRRHNNKQRRGARLETLTCNKAAVVDAEVVVARKLLKGRMKAGND
jgi:hypothetical protein